MASLSASVPVSHVYVWQWASSHNIRYHENKAAIWDWLINHFIIYIYAPSVLELEVFMQ